MNRYKLHIYFALGLMALGLGSAFGQGMYSEGSVSVLLPYSMAHPLSVNNSGAMAALQTANSVLAPAGFVGSRVVSRGAYESGHLAAFTRDLSYGSPSTCNALVRNNEVVFSFVETEGPQSSSGMAQLCNQLAGALKARFGPAAVQVQLR